MHTFFHAIITYIWRKYQRQLDREQESGLTLREMHSDLI